LLQGSCRADLQSKTRSLEGYVLELPPQPGTCDLGKPVTATTVSLDGKLNTTTDQKTGEFLFRSLPPKMVPGTHVRVQVEGRAVLIPNVGLAGHTFLPQDGESLTVCVFDPLKKGESADVAHLRRTVAAEYLAEPWLDEEAWACEPNDTFIKLMGGKYGLSADETRDALASWFQSLLDDLPVQRAVPAQTCAVRRSILYGELAKVTGILHESAESPVDPGLGRFSLTMAAFVTLRSATWKQSRCSNWRCRQPRTESVQS